MDLQDYARHDGTALADLVRRGETNPAELAALSLEAIEALNPELNAVVEVFDDVLPRLAHEVPADGPFSGVPTLTKDFMSEAGRTVEYGSELARGHVARREMAFRRRLREAGIVVLGRTATSEFGLAATTENRINGRTRNPWDVTRSVAGSSGGAAAAVAAGIVPFAQGGDGGGSIRTPASFCGLVGLKPTRGRVSGAPFSTAALSGLAINFMLTRSVRDCAALLDVMAGPEPGDSFEIPPPPRPFAATLNARPRDLRVAVATQAWSGLPVAPQVERAVRETTRTLRDLGHHVEEASPAFDYPAYLEAQKVLWCAHESRSIESVGKATGRVPGPDNLLSTTFAVYRRGRTISADEFLAALEVYDSLTRRLGAFFGDYDVLLTPTCAILPEPLGTYDPDAPGAGVDELFDQLAPKETFTALFNATGQPALSLPLGESAEGLPIGVQLAARFGDDGLLLSLAAALEEAMPWRDRRPPVHVARLNAPSPRRAHAADRREAALG